MRAVVISKHGGPGVLRVEEQPDPSISPGEIRVDVSASGVNFADVMARLGLYPDAPKAPCVVGYEVAGTVSEVGAGVEAFSIGQRVVASTKFGGYASQVTVPDNCAFALPDRFSFEQGAAIPVNYATAWAGLVDYGNLKPDGRVLILSAGGGVGIAATQIAKRIGAEVYGAASSGKHSRVLELGVDHAIDYNQAGWERNLPKFDVILDAVGGRSFRRSYSLLRGGGRLIAYGASAVVAGERRNPVAALKAVASMPRFNMIKQTSESKAVIGLNMLTLWNEHGSLQPWIKPLQEMFDDGTIDPVIAGTFSFQEAGAAQTMLTERRNIGKVLLTP
ncbi:MAG TPA: medium chain dehydrogenase/reductase family protein [Solirubrobacteraceae bacterium]|jgi:NADPH:quinone reductase-like Zn-dependent oxidoreductase|nr:medium chain dehydrogenase/reductase family protein [Solirubrobacteraceae bacterium]